MNGFMKDFIITTDTTTDLPASYVNEHHLGMMSLPYTIENQTYTWEHSLPEKEFYAMMRNGSLPTTSQAILRKRKIFLKILSEHRTLTSCTLHFLPV